MANLMVWMISGRFLSPRSVNQLRQWLPSQNACNRLSFITRWHAFPRIVRFVLPRLLFGIFTGQALCFR